MSIIGKSTKEYGLIIKKNKPQSTSNNKPKVNNVFGEDDDEEGFKSMSIDPRKETFMAQMKKSTKVNFDKALVDDPTIFEYDEVYDSFAKTDEKPVQKEFKPKYINKLLKSAEEKKLERELQMERKAQREIKADEEKYGNKEEFVTSSYKKRMEEMQSLIGKREKEEELDSVVDVTKQDNLNAFYRYMYKNKESGAREDEKPTDEPEEAITIERKPEIKEARVEKLVREERPRSHKASHEESSKSRSSHSSRHRDSDHYRDGDRKHHSHHRSHHRSSKERSHSHRRRDERTRHKSRTPPQVEKKDEKPIAEKLFESDVRRFDANGNEIFTEKSSKYWEKFIDPTKGSSSSGKEKVKKDPQVPDGFVRAKPRVTSDEQIEEYRKRFLERREEGLPKAEVVDSDEEFDRPMNN